MPIRADPRRRADVRVVAIWPAISATLDDSLASSRDGISIPAAPTARLNQRIRPGHRPSGNQKDPPYSRSKTKKLIEAGVGLSHIPTPSRLARVRMQVWKKLRLIGGTCRWPR